MCIGYTKVQVFQRPVFQLPLQKFKSLGALRGISLGIQSLLLIIDQSTLFGNISL
jgi:hypothetical protein